MEVYGRFLLCNVLFCIINIFLFFLEFYFNFIFFIWEKFLYFLRSILLFYSLIFILNYVFCYCFLLTLFFFFVSLLFLITYCFEKLFYVNMLLNLKKDSKILVVFVCIILGINNIYVLDRVLKVVKME